MHAALGQTAGLVGVEDAGGHGDVEAGLGPDVGHQFEDATQGLLVRSLDGQHDAELAGAELGGLAGGGQDLVAIQERGGGNIGFEGRRLAAEVTVLGTAAGLDRQDALDLDGVAAPFGPHVVGELAQLPER